MYYTFHEVNLKRGGSYINYPDWIKKERAIITRKYTNDKCFQYAATATLNYEEIKGNLKRVSNIKPFINKYNWEN